MDLETRAARHAALADVHRLEIVDLLSRGDLSPKEMQDRLELPSNLLAHHLGVLERAGLVSRRRSEADRRRAYLRLVPGTAPVDRPPAGDAVPWDSATSVVFVCTGNSARSQLAAALWNHHRPERSPAASSAGTRPAPRVEPRAVEVAARRGLRLADRPVGLERSSLDHALVVTVCDAAHEQLATDLASPTLHWSVPDPVPTRGRAAFESAADELEDRITRLTS